jgi:hypothetical protein
MVLGGIEIELGHAFDGRKALIGRSLGFPLISIDIGEMSLNEITPKWAQDVLAVTTHSHELGRRQTYIYLHDLLYPLFAQVPTFIDPEQRHQFLVFADDITLRKLVDWSNRLAQVLGYPRGTIAPALVNAKSEQARRMLEQAGNVVGPDWRDFNDHQCLRLTVPRPKGPDDLQAQRFHMAMARVLLSRADALVGYNYRNGLHNDNTDDDVWVYTRWIPEQGAATAYRVLPKRLAEPVDYLIQIVSNLQDSQSTGFEVLEGDSL